MKNSGKYLVFVIELVFILLWLSGKSSINYLIKFPLQSSIQLMAILGFSLLSINFILTTRLRILEKLFGGLDKVYLFHKKVGKYAYFFVVCHFSLIFISALPEWSLVKHYFLTPGNPYFFGVVASLIFDAVILFTLVIKIPYHIWKLVHQSMGLVLVIAIIHMLNAGTDVKTNGILQFALVLVSSLGLLAYIYKVFLYKYLAAKQLYIIDSVKIINDVTEIVLKSDKPLSTIYPGQFVFISVLKHPSITSEPHPFTVSAASDGISVRISAKQSGDWTKTLSQLKPGNQVMVYGPYGQFAERYLTAKSNSRQVWIAGGIGVTPFISLLQHAAQNTAAPQIDFFYSVKSATDLIYDQQIKALATQSTKINYHIYNVEKEKSFLNADKVMQIAKVDQSKDLTIFMCAPMPMMKALADQFVKSGAMPAKIVYEEFSLK